MARLSERELLGSPQWTVGHAEQVVTRSETDAKVSSQAQRPQYSNPVLDVSANPRFCWAGPLLAVLQAAVAMTGLGVTGLPGLTIMRIATWALGAQSIGLIAAAFMCAWRCPSLPARVIATALFGVSGCVLAYLRYAWLSFIPGALAPSAGLLVELLLIGACGVWALCAVRFAGTRSG